MLKIWKGPELEGFDKGVITLFVASDSIIDESIVIKELCSHNIQRVYLGAGRTQFIGFNNINNFINYCISNKISIVIEVDLLNELSEAENEIITFNNVITIFTVRKKLKPNYMFKFDNYNDVFVIKNTSVSSTNLNDLNGMLFDKDIILVDS
jgi:hypothetical protein